MLWCMQRTNIYLEDRQTAELDRAAAAEGISRAELVRRFIDEGLHGRAHDAEIDLVWITASSGVLVNVHPPTRAASARERHLDRLRNA